jgi:hypothetical protein
MDHPGLLVQDYVAGIPIWYIPNNMCAQGEQIGQVPDESTLNAIIKSSITTMVVLEILLIRGIDRYEMLMVIAGYSWVVEETSLI